MLFLNSPGGIGHFIRTSLNQMFFSTQQFLITRHGDVIMVTPVHLEGVLLPRGNQQLAIGDEQHGLQCS